MYYRFLNCGFRLPATSGTDNFSDVWRDPPPGADRTFVHVRGPLSLSSWLAGIRAGHTFGTTGPLVFLDVQGKEPGDEISLAAGARASLHVHAEALSIAPIDSLEIVANGRIVQSITGDSAHLTFDGTVDLPHGGWIAARVTGPSSRYITDSYAFAQSSPVYVVRGGHPFVSADDAQFLAAAVDALWARMERTRWRTSAERDRFKTAVDEARSVYERIARSAAN